MDQTTIRRLNTVNREFYRVTAAEFDQTRGQAWPGWLRLLDILAKHTLQPESVLDVGCGNGRFGLLIGSRWTHPLRYHGLDNSAELLKIADERLREFPHLTVTLNERDIIANPLDADEDAPRYDLVVLFGVLHHIPGAEQRLALMQALAARVNPGGVLAVAAWRFYEQARFRDRITPWPDDLAKKVERDDYLLDWRRGKNALRYCHYVDDAEHDTLVNAAAEHGLHEIARYRADGETGDANCYSVLHRVKA